jgi:hypothetical protein
MTRLPTRLHFIAACSLAWCAQVAMCEDQPTEMPSERAYHDGPLTAADFQGKRPADAKTMAWTELDYQFRYRYRSEPRGSGRVATLTEIDIWTVLRREQSWNIRPKDAALLDHEQGHFDLAQTHALEALLQLRRSFNTADVLRARGTTDKDAAKKLETQIDAALEAFVAASKESNRQYDTETGSGTNFRAQAEARQVHRARLKELHEELKKLEVKR